MHDGPDGATLLRIARATLLEDVLPHVAPEQRYTVRMIARAIEIGSRELASEAAAEREAKQRLRQAYASAGLPVPSEDLSLRETERCFARDLRAGRFDAHAALVGPLLEKSVRQRLALANPKLLGGEHGERRVECSAPRLTPTG